MPADRDAPAPARPERVLELERGFRRAGLPLFIEGYAATTDVFNRAVPLLGLVFLGEMTSELLRVAMGLAAFSGFYFAIAMLTDSTYREEFLTELTAEMGDSFAARAEYCRLRAQASDG